jgi:GNAT superfamily N-acetyltransferase
MNVVLERLDPERSYYGMKAAGKAGGFDCEHADINEFVAGSMKSGVRVGNYVAFVLLDLDNVNQSGEPFLVGFYTVSMARIPSAPVKALGATNTGNLVSCLRMNMLGVDKGYKKQGFGSRLVKHAIGRAKVACAEHGGRGLYLDADPGAYEFYVDLGFKPMDQRLPDKPTPMFLFKESFP